MKVSKTLIEKDKLKSSMKEKLNSSSYRLGLISAVDENELISVILNVSDGSTELWSTPLDDSHSYSAVSVIVPQAHWFERRLFDMFGIAAIGHPRFKSTFALSDSQFNFPLLNPGSQPPMPVRERSFLEVEGEGVYELPVGPVHAGIIEPGHFRLSCLGEEILNLELRFGYVHRGIEKRLTEVNWQSTRFLAESAASDCSIANALANAEAIESMLEISVSEKSQSVRTVALEIERVAMHIFDLSGMAYDLGFVTVAATLARLRGTSLKLAELLTGTRLMRGFVCPGGFVNSGLVSSTEIRVLANNLKSELSCVLDTFLNNDSVIERLLETGIVSKQLAEDFGFVGIVGRASDIEYDARAIFEHGRYPGIAPEIVIEKKGDALARTKVRANEIFSSLAIIDSLLESIQDNQEKRLKLPDDLPADMFGVAVVESFRGELIHVIKTGSDGKLKRYIIKDPGMNNWTGMAIASRNENIADFPICNKSFGQSYSGHDL